MLHVALGFRAAENFIADAVSSKYLIECLQSSAVSIAASTFDSVDAHRQRIPAWRASSLKGGGQCNRSRHNKAPISS